ncbi:MAG: hypothetical protein O3A46_09865 [Candidatus Poribacteria bacterium]|nr:hypothetical protein [Candidatus Poribacteria bacterium]
MSDRYFVVSSATDARRRDFKGSNACSPPEAANLYSPRRYWDI